jgi:hypothetical protein
MLTLSASACIDADVHTVWSALSSLESIPLWVPAIRRAHCPHAHRGVGAERICELPGATVHETVVEWDEGRSFKYRGEGAPMMKRATNTWAVEARGHQTLVTSTAEVELKGGVLGRLLEPLARAAAMRAGRRALAALKYWVEHGKPFEGRLSSLPSPAAAC